MSFFNINGWNVPIVNGGMSETSTQYGNSGKSFTNRALISRRMNPRTWSGSMLFQTPSVADTVEGLLMGRGHHFPLNTNFWSDSGVAPTSLASKSIVEGGGLQRFGTGHASFTADMSFDVGFPTKKWTVIVWADNTGSGEWHQHVETATGDTYQDGVATAVTSFITVADGIVTIDYTNFPAGTVSKDMDDLVLLPFNVDASFIADLYTWQNADGIVMQCPFDYPGDFADRVNGIEGVPTATIADPIAAGDPNRKTGSGSLLNISAADKVEFPGSSPGPIELNTDDEITVCFWVNPSSGAIAAASPDLAEQFALTYGWVFSLAAGNARIFYQLVGTSASINDPDKLVADEWAHLTMVYSSPTTTPTLSLYKNGTLIGTDTATTIATTSSAENIYMGDKGGTDSALCNIDDFRYYKQALSANQIAEIYSHGLYGYDFIPPQDRAFSKLPRLLVSGDCIGSQHPKEVIGKVDSEAYVQHGGTYSPNDRSINLMLQEVSPLQESGISRPDANFILDPEFVIDQINGPYSLDASGGYEYEKKAGAAAPTLVYDIDDGFGFCQSFDPVNAQGFELPSDHSGFSNLSSDLGGHSGVSVGAWIYVENMTVGTILNIPIKAGPSFSKVALNVHTDNGGSIQWGGRSRSADINFQGLTSNTDVLSTGEWYFILGTLDLPSATASIYANVASKTTVSLLDEVTSLSFGQTTFSAENGGTGAGTIHGSVIGTNDVPQNFDGKIKSVMVWKRVIEMDEIVTTFRKGYDRRIFR